MRQKILVVDDDADMRQVLLCGLDPIGDITEASNGRDALRKISAEKPRLVLLDVSMPEMNGLQVLLAAREIAPSLVVVMLTGEFDLEIAKKALELGARTYITKPFDMDVVSGEVQRLLEDASGGSGSVPYRPWRVAT